MVLFTITWDLHDTYMAYLYTMFAHAYQESVKHCMAYHGSSLAKSICFCILRLYFYFPKYHVSSDVSFSSRDPSKNITPRFYCNSLQRGKYEQYHVISVFLLSLNFFFLFFTFYNPSERLFRMKWANLKGNSGLERSPI